MEKPRWCCSRISERSHVQIQFIAGHHDVKNSIQVSFRLFQVLLALDRIIDDPGLWNLSQSTRTLPVSASDNRRCFFSLSFRPRESFVSPCVMTFNYQPLCHLKNYRQQQYSLTDATKLPLQRAWTTRENSFIISQEKKCQVLGSQRGTSFPNRISSKAHIPYVLTGSVHENSGIYWSPPAPKKQSEKHVTGNSLPARDVHAKTFCSRASGKAGLLKDLQCVMKEKAACAI